MFWILFIGLIIAVVCWVSYNISTKGKAQLKTIAACIKIIEKNPNSPAAYDKFIKFWKSSTWLQIDDFLSGGYYDRILKICEANSSNVKAWEILANVLQTVNISFRINSTDRDDKAKTVRLLAESLFKEFQNPLIKERILSLIHSISGLTQAETKDLYDTSLKLLEDNSTSQEAKKLVLDLGRLHYSILRPNKKPTIYDEQAIQNDIIVREK